MFEDANKYCLQENFFHMYVYSKKINLFLFYVDEGFSQMCVCEPCAYAARGDQRRVRSFENWSYKQFWVAMWVLGSKPGSSARAASALNMR